MNEFNKFAFKKALHGVKMAASHYRVLVTVWDYADEHGCNAYPTVAKLAQDCCMSTRTVDRALECLKGDGWLRQVSRGRRGRGGVGWASVYSLTIPASPALQDDSQRDTGDESTRHGCQINTTPVSGQRDVGDVPTYPETDLRTNPGTNLAACWICLGSGTFQDEPCGNCQPPQDAPPTAGREKDNPGTNLAACWICLGSGTFQDEPCGNCQPPQDAPPTAGREKNSSIDLPPENVIDPGETFSTAPASDLTLRELGKRIAHTGRHTSMGLAD